jgi:hypothetical protein
VRRDRWERCVSHRGEEEIRGFCTSYLPTLESGRLGVIAAAGFDPRSCLIPREIAAKTGHAHAVFIREERPSSEPGLLQRAEANVVDLTHLFTTHQIVKLNVLDENNAVVGGRNIVTELQGIADRFAWTDVIIDASAMSIGISFPLIRYFLERSDAGQEPRNVHVMIAANAMLDEAIEPIASDSMAYVHAFRGPLKLHSSNKVAKLWLPQLAHGRGQILERVFRTLAPHDTLPILPFPSANPRYADELMAEYAEEFESEWEVSAGDLVYADESDPLDLYRSVLHIHDASVRVFTETGGAAMVISPIGSKASGLGALMAACERDMAIAYVEAVGFSVKSLPAPGQPCAPCEWVHVWLAGDVYA